MGSTFSKYQSRIRKGYSSQHCLLSMFEKLKLVADNRKIFGLVLLHLLERFNCLSHEPLIWKLYLQGTSFAAIRLTCSYSTNRKEKSEINYSYIS